MTVDEAVALLQSVIDQVQVNRAQYEQLNGALAVLSNAAHTAPELDSGG